AETDSVADHARRKLAEKSADLIVANDVTAPGAGFDHETNIVTLYTRDGGEMSLPRMTKLEVAQRVLDAVLALKQPGGRRVASPAASPDASSQASTAAPGKAR
ncbi:MAG TPA: phosphopantothenoylcysteine decarboxylase, partial [Candidatus Acidoferrales bacterium]